MAEHQKSKSDKAAMTVDGVEPVYDIERGAALNEKAGENDPAFKHKMEAGRKAAAKVAPKS